MNNKLKIFIIAIFFLASYKVANAAITIRPALNLGLVGYWSMDEGTGTTVRDQSGNGNTVTSYSSTTPAATWTDGKLGKALNFDGVDDRAVLANIHNATSSFSISVWANNTGSSGLKSDNRIFMDGRGSVEGWGVGYGDSDGTIRFTKCKYVDLDINIGSWPTGWTHYAWVVGNDNDVELFINGVSMGKYGNTHWIEPNPNTVPLIGVDVGATNDYSGFWHGSIDEVRIYNRALSEGEVTRLYSLTKPKLLAPNTIGLVGYWSFDDGLGTKAGDMSGRGNDGQLSTVGTMVAEDNFNRADENPLAGNWRGLNRNLKIVSNAAHGDGNYDNTAAVWDANTFNADQYSQVAVGTLDADGSAGPAVRMSYVYTDQITDYSYYVVLVSAASIQVQKHTKFNGEINIGSAYSRTHSPGDVYRLSAVGNFLTVSANGTEFFTVRDSSLSSGSPGIGIWVTGSNSAADNWEGGNLVANINWTDGKRGKALDFNGTDSYVSANTSQDTRYTISMWIYPRDVTLEPISNMAESPGSDVKDRNFYIDADSKIVARIWDGEAKIATSTTSLVPNQWYYVTQTYDGTNLTIFVNGVSEGITTANDPYTGYASPEYVLGFTDTDVDLAYSLSDNYFDGKIDEVRIYNRALSAAEVATLYSSSKKIIKYNTSQNNKVTDGLVGMWSFNGPDIAGSIAIDRSGQNNNGTITGATIINGKVGQALKFNGTSNYIVLNSDSIADNTVTVCAWIYPKDFNSWQSIVGNDHFIFGPYDSSASLILTSAGGSGSFIFSENNSLSLNQWQHVCAIRMSNGDGSIYVNGSLSGTPGSTDTPYPAIETSAAIGATRGLGDGGFFHGYIDEVRLYNRALTAAEVKRLYNLGR